MTVLLPEGDESAMNFEAVSVSFRRIYRFPRHFCEYGVNFAEKVPPRRSRLKKPHRDGPMGLAYGGHNTCLKYYLVLMYKLDRRLFVHKNIP
jgi:hypothetical protein